MDTAAGTSAPRSAVAAQFRGRRGMDAGCRVGGGGRAAGSRPGRRRGDGQEVGAGSRRLPAAAAGDAGTLCFALGSGGGCEGRRPELERGAQCPVRVRNAPAGVGARHPQWHPGFGGEEAAPQDEEPPAPRPRPRLEGEE